MRCNERESSTHNTRVNPRILCRSEGIVSIRGCRVRHIFHASMVERFPNSSRR
ncbi:hypothetical protein RSAG8_05957, partial [Rhizoctonia solani AG-8 WAC10335]